MRCTLPRCSRDAEFTRSGTCSTNCPRNRIHLQSRSCATCLRHRRGRLRWRRSTRLKSSSVPAARRPSPVCVTINRSCLRSTSSPGALELPSELEPRRIHVFYRTEAYPTNQRLRQSGCDSYEGLQAMPSGRDKLPEAVRIEAAHTRGENYPAGAYRRNRQVCALLPTPHLNAPASFRPKM